jgi:hypothetical protein
MSTVFKGGTIQMVATLRKLAAGVIEYYGGKTLVLEGKAWKAADLQAFLLAQANALEAATALATQWKQATAKNKVVFTTQVTPMLAALKSYVANTYGSTSTEFTGMGYTAPKKRGPRPVQDKIVTVAKTLATRAARHIMGDKQRQTIVATPDAVNAIVATLAPAAAATPAKAAPAPAPAPAPAAATTPATATATSTTGVPNGAPNGTSHS